jgi:hypothetical protein
LVEPESDQRRDRRDPRVPRVGRRDRPHSARGRAVGSCSGPGSDQEIPRPPPPGPRFPVPAESGNGDSPFPDSRPIGKSQKRENGGSRFPPIPDRISTLDPCCGRASASKFGSVGIVRKVRPTRSGNPNSRPPDSRFGRDSHSLRECRLVMERRHRLFAYRGYPVIPRLARMFAREVDGTDFRLSRNGDGTVPVAAHSLRECRRGMSDEAGCLLTVRLPPRRVSGHTESEACTQVCHCWSTGPIFDCREAVARIERVNVRRSCVCVCFLCALEYRFERQAKCGKGRDVATVGWLPSDVECRRLRQLLLHV